LSRLLQWYFPLGIHEDRIAILISPPAIPRIARSTGAAQAEAVMNALKEWDIVQNFVGSVPPSLFPLPWVRAIPPARPSFWPAWAARQFRKT
jgi:hypothetical protein